MPWIWPCFKLQFSRKNFQGLKQIILQLPKSKQVRRGSLKVMKISDILVQKRLLLEKWLLVGDTVNKIILKILEQKAAKLKLLKIWDLNKVLSQKKSRLPNFWSQILRTTTWIQLREITSFEKSCLTVRPNEVHFRLKPLWNRKLS